MLPVYNCSQFYPYADKTSPCSGELHELTVHVDGLIESKKIQVCGAHTESFKELGQREKYSFMILSDTIIGEITPASLEGQGQQPTKERK